MFWGPAYHLRNQVYNWGAHIGDHTLGSTYWGGGSPFWGDIFWGPAYHGQECFEKPGSQLGSTYWGGALLTRPN